MGIIIVIAIMLFTILLGYFSQVIIVAFLFFIVKIFKNKRVREIIQKNKYFKIIIKNKYFKIITKKKYLIIIFLYLIILIYSLFFYEKSSTSNKKNNISDYIEFGVKYNNERKKRGIPLLPEYWEYNFTDSNTIKFSYDYKPEIISEKPIEDFIYCNPYHAYKVLYFDKGKLVKETDVYYGLKAHISDPDDVYLLFPENITIVYDYKKELNREYPWSYILDKTIGFTRDAESITEADSILKSWGLSRLTYNYQADTTIFIK